MINIDVNPKDFDILNNIEVSELRVSNASFSIEHDTTIIIREAKYTNPFELINGNGSRVSVFNRIKITYTTSGDINPHIRFYQYYRRSPSIICVIEQSVLNYIIREINLRTIIR